MTNEECVRFLQWALSRLHLRWPGFRKVRRQVCRRLSPRLKALKLADLRVYREYLEANPKEWEILDGFCRITISRFYRDRAVFDFLECAVLPEIVHRVETLGERRILAWSVGCASGEEPYTLGLLWRLGLGATHPDLNLRTLATDADLNVLQRARQACYGPGSLKQLPKSWLARAFERVDQQYLLKPMYRRGILFVQHDVRKGLAGGCFDLVLCRNLVFTYFDAEFQHDFARRIRKAMTPEGVLVIGASETLPANVTGFSLWPGSRGIYRKEFDRN